jgi:hypothetical protein
MPLNIKDIVDIRPAAHGLRPPPDSSHLPEGYRYVPITFRLKGPTERDLIPYMVGATYIFLSLLLLQWRTKSKLSWISDLNASATCSALHNIQQPLLSLYLALAYTIWNLHPGSLSSKNLPSHKHFMHNLKTTKASELLAECMICWSEDCDLAQLPCNHLFCTPCLQQMGEGERFQTKCPMCRLPLFGAHDRLMLIAEKGNYVCFAIMATKLLIDLSFELMRRRYGWALFHLSVLGFLLSMPVYAIFKLRAAGITIGQWWGNSQGKVGTRNTVRVSLVVFLCGLITTGINVCNDYHRFKRA